ncbi:nuclear transport factor 2 family protein [Microbispora sp. NPDC046933]|uniref:nuclear transport factor 2 family protein n=1 Tax=Microbispora sp. NPDC046933 TaxID=3155618 RepID=UPI0033FF07CE
MVDDTGQQPGELLAFGVRERRAQVLLNLRQYATDRYELSDLVARLGRLLDEKRLGDVRTVFTEDASVATAIGVNRNGNRRPRSSRDPARCAGPGSGGFPSGGWR